MQTEQKQDVWTTSEELLSSFSLSKRAGLQFVSFSPAFFSPPGNENRVLVFEGKNDFFP